jgi:GT2 family glycosyltransferase
MTKPGLVSVIIVNYNGRKYLKNCFDSLEKVDYPDFELVFVDNGSSDDSVELIRKNYPKVKVLELRANLGLAVASNRGADVAQGEYLFFLNNDTIVEKNILTELVKAAQSDKKVAVCACNVFTYDGKDQIGGGIGLSVDRFGYPCGRLGELFYPDAAIFIRNKVFGEIAGFDPELFLYGEDRDLCWRVWLKGYRIIPVETAKFLHDSACGDIEKQKNYKTNTWKRELGERNLIRSMLKNYSFSTLVYILPQYILLSLLELMALIFSGQYKVVKDAYLKAYIWNIKNFNDTWNEHKKINSGRVIPDRLLRKKMARPIGKIYVFKKIGIPEFETRSYKLGK